MYNACDCSLDVLVYVEYEELRLFNLHTPLILRTVAYNIIILLLYNIDIIIIIIILDA